MDIKCTETDVLIIGSGASGLRAAIEAKSSKVQVSLFSKAPVGLGSCTTYSAAGFSVSVEDFSTLQHFKNTIESGRYLNDQELVEILVNEAPMRVPELRKFGVKLYSSSQGYYCIGVPPIWGLEITNPLTKTALDLGIKMYEKIMIIDLIKTENFVVGALGFDIMNGKFLILKTKSIVLATGGAGALYLHNDNPIRTTGDGYATAYRSGVELQDMEFVQFYPLGVAEPGLPTYILPPSLADFGRILNVYNENIPEKYGITEKPLAIRARDLLSRALYLEISKGNGRTVLLDLTQISDAQEMEILRRKDAFISMKDILIHKFKIKEKPIRISPVCHHFMGGLRINRRCETNVMGLYAAGEVTGGVHGANRLGGNALSEAVVFGARAGYYAAKYAKSAEEPQFDLEEVNQRKKELESFFHNKGKNCCKTIRATIEEIMWKKVGIIRSKEVLDVALEELQRIREESLPNLNVRKNRELMEALEIMNGLIVAEMVAKSALYRTESRGAHYRSDYPEQNDRKWLTNIIIRKGETQRALRSVKITKSVPPHSE